VELLGKMSKSTTAMVAPEEPAYGRRAKTKSATRIKLLTAAYKLMSTRGVGTTAINEITQAADVGFGTFYNYFESKDDIATQVLDCTINTLGQRFDLTNRAAKVKDPVQVIANSIRLCSREMSANPIWNWWLQRPDLMVDRMRVGFGPFGLRDMKLATAGGKYKVADNDLETAWSFLIWLLAGSCKDIAEGRHPEASGSHMCEAVLRVMGVDLDTAHKISHLPLPKLQRLDINFQFGQPPPEKWK
jgi:AcrR family transcriptional regulator